MQGAGTSAVRPWAGLACIALAGLSAQACSGTERAVFAAVEREQTSPVLQPNGGSPSEPPPTADAGEPPPPPPDAAGEPGRPDAGLNGPDPGLDRSVKFVWTETLPGAGTCRGGQYVGSFTCTAPELLVPLTGELVVSFSVAPEQQKLAVEEGTVKGAFYLAPSMAGELDCPTRTFDGTSVDGMDLFTLETFDATLHGTLDVDTLVIEGEIVVMNSLAQECRGTFRLGAAP